MKEDEQNSCVHKNSIKSFYCQSYLKYAIITDVIKAGENLPRRRNMCKIYWVKSNWVNSIRDMPDDTWKINVYTHYKFLEEDYKSGYLFAICRDDTSKTEMLNNFRKRFDFSVCLDKKDVPDKEFEELFSDLAIEMIANGVHIPRNVWPGKPNCDCDKSALLDLAQKAGFWFAPIGPGNEKGETYSTKVRKGYVCNMPSNFCGLAWATPQALKDAFGEDDMEANFNRADIFMDRAIKKINRFLNYEIVHIKFLPVKLDRDDYNWYADKQYWERLSYNLNEKELDEFFQLLTAEDIHNLDICDCLDVSTLRRRRQEEESQENEAPSM